MDIQLAWWILIVVLVLFGIGALMRKHNEKVLGFNKTGFGWVLLIAGAFVFLWQGSFLTGIGLNPSSTLAVTGTIPQIITSGSGACAPGQQVEDTTVTLSATDAFNTSASGGTHRYRINGGPATTVADAGTFTALPGDVLSVLWGNGATTSGYYSFSQQLVVPCKG